MLIFPLLALPFSNPLVRLPRSSRFLSLTLLYPFSFPPSYLSHHSDRSQPRFLDVDIAWFEKIELKCFNIDEFYWNASNQKLTKTRNQPPPTPQPRQGLTRCGARYRWAEVRDGVRLSEMASNKTRWTCKKHQVPLYNCVLLKRNLIIRKGHYIRPPLALQ